MLTTGLHGVQESVLRFILALQPLLKGISGKI